MDSLDLLISASMEGCIAKEAEEFLSIEVEKVYLTERIKRKILKKCANAEKGYTKFHPLKVACVACLIIMSLLFTACMSIKEVRETIWKIVIEYYDDHLAVNFKDSAGNDNNNIGGSNNNDSSGGIKDPDTTQTGDNTSDVDDNKGNDVVTPPIDEKPTKIEQYAYLSVLPDEYSVMVVCDVRSLRVLEVYYQNIMQFTLTQAVIGDEGLYLDNESGIITNEKISGHDGILIKYKNETDYYTLTWCDGNYIYTITGNFENKQFLLSIAEGLRLQ